MSKLYEKLSFGEVSEGYRTSSIVEWERYLEEAKLEIEDPDVFVKTYEDFMSTGVAHAVVETYKTELIKFDPASKSMYYVLMSALQKAIRYGRVDDALMYYRSLAKNGYDHQIRSRLRTIVYEDIGVGDPFLCALTMKLTGQKVVHQEMIECLIVLMCTTDKSRLQTDFWQALTYKIAGGYEAFATDVRKKSVEDDMLMMEVFLMVLMKRGNKNSDLLPGVPMMKVNHSDIIKLATRLKAPVVYEQMIFEAMNMAIPFVASLIPATAMVLKYPLKPSENPYPKTDEKYLDGTLILEAALDQHTVHGKKAMAYVLKSDPDLMPPEYVCSKINKLDVLGHAIFRVEGAWLSSMVSNDEMDEIWKQSMHDCWEVEGWASVEEVEGYYGRVIEKLPKLRHARNRVWS